MTDSEKIDLILSEVLAMKTEIQDIKAKVQDIDRRLTNVELHLENFTDKNIALIAENFIELTNKPNLAIPAADKNLAYEVKVNYLIKKIPEIEQRVEKLRL